MNYYVVCEGSKTEPKVYAKWIPFINSKLSQVDLFLNLKENNFYIISGYGYPNYRNIIINSIKDICENLLDATLVIIIDAENFTPEEKIQELETLINTFDPYFLNYKLVVQTPSIEGWCLGNLKFISPSPQSATLNKLLTHYNVRTFDPQNIHEYDERNKAQTSTYYLKEAAKEKGVTYSKSDPSLIAHTKYIENLIYRNLKTNHINTIKILLETFGQY